MLEVFRQAYRNGEIRSWIPCYTVRYKLDERGVMYPNDRILYGCTRWHDVEMQAGILSATLDTVVL